MCEYASFIVCKGFKVFFGSLSDSHSKIRDEHGLPHNTCGEIKNVQVEYIPQESKTSRLQKDWEFRVDQDQLPSWWDKEEARKACWAAIPKLEKTRSTAMIVKLPDGYEKAPDEHILRRDIDMGPAPRDGGGAKTNGKTSKTAPYGFQWVKGWDGSTVGKSKNGFGVSGYLGYFIRPIEKPVKKPYKQNRVTIHMGLISRRITIPKGYTVLKPTTLVKAADMIYDSLPMKFVQPSFDEVGCAALDFYCVIRKVK